MRPFIHLILFVCLFIKNSSSNYVLCTPRCDQVTLSFPKPLEIPVVCQDRNNNTNIYENALICIIDYRIDYDAKSIYINFQASNNTDTFKEYNQSEFLIQTIWFNPQSKPTTITHRKYVCNTNTDCARQFYLNTIEHLITGGKLQLDRIHSKLYKRSLSLNASTHHHCIDSTRTGNRSKVLCKNGLCYARSINVTQYCTNDNIPNLFSEIEYHLPKSQTNERELIEYKCNRKLCNNNATMAVIKQHLLNYTNWNQIAPKSSTIHQTISYCLVVFSLFNLRFIF